MNRGLNAIFRFLRDEPTAHFFLVAFLILLGHGIYASLFQPRIVLAANELEEMVDAMENNPARLGQAVDPQDVLLDWTAEEILYREAVARGLTETPAIRSLLANQLRASLEPVVRDPTNEELVALRTEDPESFKFPAQIAFDHVSFALDDKDVPPDLLKRLRRGEIDPASLGRLQLRRPFPLDYRPQVERIFGEDAANRFFSAERGIWEGPISSSVGLHYVKVLERKPPSPIPFDQIVPTLRANWIKREKDRAVAAQLLRLAENYRIELPGQLSLEELLERAEIP